jgi:hypothetical protein
MHKWIQLAEKLLRHLDYTNLATQICISTITDFGQTQTEKVTGKLPKDRTFKLLHKYSPLYLCWGVL